MNTSTTAYARILIVDDDVAHGRMMKTLLEQSGLYKVRVENNGTEALASAHAFLPNLVLLDVVMPEMDGGDVASTLRADPIFAHTPILFLTGLVSGDGVFGGRMSGGFRFLGKPVRRVDLLAAVSSALHGAGVEKGGACAI